MAIEARMFGHTIQIAQETEIDVPKPNRCSNCEHYQAQSSHDQHYGYCQALQYLGAHRKGFDALWNPAPPDTNWNHAPFVNIGGKCKAFNFNEETRTWEPAWSEKDDDSTGWTNIPVDSE